MLPSLRIQALARGKSVSLFEQLMKSTPPTTSLRGSPTSGHCAPSPNRSQARYQKTRDSFSALEPAKLFRLTNPRGPRESQLSLRHSPHISCPSSSCSSYPVSCPVLRCKSLNGPLYQSSASVHFSAIVWCLSIERNFQSYKPAPTTRQGFYCVVMGEREMVSTFEELTVLQEKYKSLH